MFVLLLLLGFSCGCLIVYCCFARNWFVVILFDFSDCLWCLLNCLFCCLWLLFAVWVVFVWVFACLLYCFILEFDGWVGFDCFEFEFGCFIAGGSVGFKFVCLWFGGLVGWLVLLWLVTLCLVGWIYFRLLVLCLGLMGWVCLYWLGLLLFLGLYVGLILFDVGFEFGFLFVSVCCLMVRLVCFDDWLCITFI